MNCAICGARLFWPGGTMKMYVCQWCFQSIVPLPEVECE